MKTVIDIGGGFVAYHVANLVRGLRLSDGTTEQG